MHLMKEMIEQRKQGKTVGIPSYCTANELVLEAILEHARDKQTAVLIESTANQVNQFGGYTGMVPQDFVDFVKEIAARVNCPEELILLGGDHLGPLTWQNDTEAEAMKKSKDLVYQYVLAGFSKIHLDTSMKVADDAADEPLSTEVIARRGAVLYKKCIEAFEERRKKYPETIRPVFIIGSEVPIPGGAQEEEEGIGVTKPEDFRHTVETYQRIFREAGLADAWDDIIAVVVQPGVEFGDGQIFQYDRDAAAELCEELEAYPNLVFEGHSTDYQSPKKLREMVEDGIAILKVGPALTFGLHQAIFSLSMIEKELVPEEERAYFNEILERTMLKKPDNWQNHYHGDDKEKELARKYSFSDRSRYYLGEPEVEAAIDKLLANMAKREIPLNILQHYMPMQYQKVRDGEIDNEPRALIKEGVLAYINEYEYAVNG